MSGPGSPTQSPSSAVSIISAADKKSSMIIHYTYVIINHNDDPPDFCREESDMIKQIMNLANFVDFFYHTFRGVASKTKYLLLLETGEKYNEFGKFSVNFSKMLLYFLSVGRMMI